jgi:hypothetical protein
LKTGVFQKGTGNREQGTGNREQGTGKSIGFGNKTQLRKNEKTMGFKVNAV